MITPQTIVEFLFFRRSAILSIAQGRYSLLLGLVFVVSAGLAREYDGEFLLAEPWHLALPLLASLIGCFVLVFLVWLASIGKLASGGFLPMFIAFLKLYWMTAPLAWLYAIPVERFLDPGDATKANLLLLAIVSFWRVCLMVRAISVVCGISVAAATMPVLLFSDAMAYLAMQWIPAPLFLIMGGVRLTESESFIMSMRLLLTFAGFVSAPIWIIGYLVICASQKPWQWHLQSESVPESISASLWAMAAFSLVFWIPILFVTQPEQRLRWQAEQLLRNADIDGLCRLTDEHPRDAFPPHWDPPPRMGYGESKPDLLTTVRELKENGCRGWLWNIYLEKMTRHSERMSDFFSTRSLRNFSDEELERYVETVEGLENSAEIAKNLQYAIERELERYEDLRKPLSPARSKSLETLKYLDRSTPLE